MIIHNPILTGSFTVNGTNVASITSSADSITALNNYTASQNLFSASMLSYTASQNTLNGTYATTSSNTFTGIQTVNSNLVVTGSITAQTLVVQTITSSVDFVTGSTRFGSILSNTHVFSGSITMNPGGLFVSSSGAVLVGTTSATGVSTGGRFQVTGTTAQILVSNTTNSGHLALYSTGVDAYISKNTASGSLMFGLAPQDGSTFTEHMRITSAGNVGIGTSNPQVLLHLYDASLPRLQFSNSTTGTASTDGFQIYQSGLTAIVTNKEAGDVVFGTSDTERMRITSAGNVGIGTSTPYVALQVNGNIHRQFTGTGTSGSPISEEGFVYSEQSNSTALAGMWFENNFQSASGVSVVFKGRTNAGSIGERMRITNDGNVLIGTTTDLGAKLYVDGVIYANGTGGFASATYIVGARNPIWRFANADAYGLSYYQGTAGYGSNDTIGFHFGGSTTTSSGSAFQFIANGNYIFAGSPISDRRVKENINDLTFNATEKVMALQSRSYYMKEGNNKIKYGFIAQEVYEVLPDLISGDLEKDSIVGLDYNGLIPVLVKAIQELEARLKTLENK